MTNIFEFIKNNNEVITIILSVSALIISLITSIKNHNLTKKNLYFKVNSFTKGLVENKEFYFFNIDLINKSRLPISINEISIKSDDYYPFIKSPRILAEKNTKRNKEIIAEYVLKSESFPINLLELESKNVYLVMYGPANIENIDYEIFMKTNRGLIMKKESLYNCEQESSTFFKEAMNYCIRVK